MDSSAEPEAAGEDPRYLAGIALFNARYYFDAHDAWEDLWADTRDSDRRFYQSLIHAAVAIYHWRNDNLKGARHVLDYFLDKVRGYPDVHHGLELGKLRAAIDAFFSNLGKAPFDREAAPVIETRGLVLPEPQPVEGM